VRPRTPGKRRPPPSSGGRDRRSHSAPEIGHVIEPLQPVNEYDQNQDASVAIAKQYSKLKGKQPKLQAAQDRRRHDRDDQNVTEIAASGNQRTSRQSS